MPKVIVIGKHAAILPFKSVGVSPVDVEDAEGARQALRAVREEGGDALVLIPEDLAEDCQNEIRSLRNGSDVVILTLPALSGEVGSQRERVRQLVARSLGVDMMGKR